MLNQIAQMIDHTLLKQDATREQIKTLCEEAKIHQFASVCVNPAWVKDAATFLQQSTVKVCTVIGFPLGANTVETKIFEAKNALANGAEEVDLMINIGALKSGDKDLIQREITSIVHAVFDQAIVKVIIETCLLTNKEKEDACLIAKQAGAHFVKTSTGFSSGGATVEDVALMRKVVGDQVGVKASGGIRSLHTAEKMIQAGASRIGTSSGVAIVKELKVKQRQ